jgi:hypothetical protein
MKEDGSQQSAAIIRQLSAADLREIKKRNEIKTR